MIHSQQNNHSVDDQCSESLQSIRHRFVVARTRVCQKDKEALPRALHRGCQSSYPGRLTSLTTSPSRPPPRLPDSSRPRPSVAPTKSALTVEIPSSIPRIPHTEIPSFPIPSPPPPPLPAELEWFGITKDLREFARGVALITFRDFPMDDEKSMSEVSTMQQDLNKWQVRNATLILFEAKIFIEAKEISKFRYELCPRYMKERKFWRIYFILVNNFVAPYERKYMEELNQKSQEQKQHDAKENPTSAPALQAESKETKLQSKTSTSTSREQDLDVFLLGDLGSSDEGPDDGDDAFDDDFDKIENASGLDSEDDQQTAKKS